jgi:DNA-binding NtrC family response regulator
MNRILLVEDEADVRMLLEHVLLSAEYRVDSVATVEAACALLDTRSYDLVVADGRLEDGTGMMVAEKAAESATKVLIITGYAFDLPRDQLGRYEFLLKPVRPQELLDAIGRVLDGARS